MIRTHEAPEREREGGRVVALLVLGLVLLAGGGYVAAVLVAGDRVPRGTAVSGIDVGGLPQAEAASYLSRTLGDRADAPLRIRVGGLTRSVRPKQAGLSVDYQASVSTGGGPRGWDPGRLWGYYTDGDDLDPVVVVDRRRLDSLVRRLDAEVAREPRDGRIDFDSGRAQVTEPVVGRRVDDAAAREILVTAYAERVGAADGATSAQVGGELALALRDVQPDISASDIRTALDDFANPALAGPVTLVFDTSRVRLQPRDFAPALELRARRGELVPGLRTSVLGGLVDDAVAAGRIAPVDAQVRPVDGRRTVLPGEPGTSYDPRDVARSLLQVLTRTDGLREVAVPTTKVPSRRVALPQVGLG